MESTVVRMRGIMVRDLTSIPWQTEAGAPDHCEFEVSLGYIVHTEQPELCREALSENKKHSKNEKQTATNERLFSVQHLLL